MPPARDHFAHLRSAAFVPPVAPRAQHLGSIAIERVEGLNQKLRPKEDPPDLEARLAALEALLAGYADFATEECDGTPITVLVK